MKCGFVTIIGRPNVGKSTLLNQNLGQKIVITTDKAQTTRKRIKGIYTTERGQIVFVDTPGIYNGKSELAKFLQKSTETATSGVDAIVILLDAGKINQVDYDLISKYENSEIPVYVVVNKIDISSYEKLYPVLAKLNEFRFVKKFITLSALRKRNIEELVTTLLEELPEGPAYYDRDIYTDKNLRFMVSEIVREKALLFLQEEIPHGLAVDIILYK